MCAQMPGFAVDAGPPNTGCPLIRVVLAIERRRPPFNPAIRESEEMAHSSLPNMNILVASINAWVATGERVLALRCRPQPLHVCARHASATLAVANLGTFVSLRRPRSSLYGAARSADCVAFALSSMKSCAGFALTQRESQASALIASGTMTALRVA